MKIIIVGGGTAGWLAALILSKLYNHDITVVESSKIGIIGVGEGGTHVIGSLFNNNSEFNFDPRQFMEQTEGAPKIAVHHKGWPNTYHLPLDILPDSDREDFLPLLIVEDKPIREVSPLGLFISEGKMPIRKDETGVWTETEWSFHFDGHLVGQFLKRRSKNVKVIDSVIDQISIDDFGIKEIFLENGISVAGDLYIDCTGFNRLLMNKLDNKWISYKQNLIMNSAIPFRLPYQAFNDIAADTQARSMSSGWTWTIPLFHKVGLGYVYCDDFITYDDALKELKEVYSPSPINPVKHIKFEAGRLEKLWYKNCVALGLCSAFVEPLEATSIHATKLQIDALGKALEKNSSQEYYNDEIGSMYDDIKDFILLHYLGGRTNSEFWRYCSSGAILTDRVKEILEIASHRMLTKDDIKNPFNHLSYRAWNQVLAGLGKFSKEVAKKSITEGMSDRYTSWKKNTLDKIEDYKTVQEALYNGDWTT